VTTGTMLPLGSVTVVIASPREPALAAACVASVAAQARALGAPVILARCGDAGAVVATAGEPASMVSTIDAPAGSSLPVLRGVGLSAVRTPYAALIEDHCVAAPGWLAALCAAGSAAPPPDFVGGRMGNAQRRRAVDWAAYFAEYGFFAGTALGGAAPLATGANVLYGPRALPLAARWASDGLWEDVIHARLLDRGCRLAVTPSAEMRQNLRYAIAAFCRDRYQHGFAYARVRLREASASATGSTTTGSTATGSTATGSTATGPTAAGTAATASAKAMAVRRWARVFASPLLPFVLARRLWANVASDERAAFRRALPLTLLFLAAWSVGEMMGYVRGRAS
jgi:hypothetical protein